VGGIEITKNNDGHVMEYEKCLKIPKGGNQNTYIEEEQTTQWPKEKVQKDQQRTTKHITYFLATA
jgi:hypothetical protein